MIPKFRGYDSYNKKMVYSIDIACDDEISEQYVPVFNYRGKLVLIDVDNDDKELKLMQSTGLKDKNGVEIFEGDIVTTKSGENYVIIRSKTGLYKAVERTDEETYFMTLANVCHLIEVIGNIYENSELLED